VPDGAVGNAVPTGNVGNAVPAGKVGADVKPESGVGDGVATVGDNGSAGVGKLVLVVGAVGAESSDCDVGKVVDVVGAGAKVGTPFDDGSLVDPVVGVLVMTCRGVGALVDSGASDGGLVHRRGHKSELLPFMGSDL